MSPIDADNIHRISDSHLLSLGARTEAALENGDPRYRAAHEERLKMYLAEIERRCA